MKMAAILGLLTGLASGGAAAAQDLSGQYGPMLVAERQGQIAAVYAEIRVGNGEEDRPQFSCLFMLKGRLSDGNGAVDTWFPETADRIGGDLALKNGRALLRLSENHGGCGMTTGDMTREPLNLVRTYVASQWIGVGLIKVDRAVIHSAPSAGPTRRRPYVVASDAVAILERRGDWTRIEVLGDEVLGDERPLSGWIRNEELSANLVEAS